MTATARPQALDVNPDGIPAALKARAQWVGWEYEYRGDKWTKVPLCVATGGVAESDNPATWGTFEAALKAYRGRGYAGVGYMFSADDPYCGIDLDKCLGGNSVPNVTAGTIMMELDSCTEISPSTTGLHIIVEAALPGGKGRKSVRHGIEMYDRGRFFTITGHQLNGTATAIIPRQAELDDLYARLFPVRVGEEPRTARPQGTSPPDDQALIDRAHRAKNGAGFARLWRGDTGGHHDDDSSADLALCNHLAFWSGPDPARIDRLFRQSSLYRTKWERASYREPTIARALAGRTAFYGWGSADDRDEATFDLEAAGGADDPATEESADTPDPARYALTDKGNIRLFVALHRDELRFDHRRGAWLRWGQHWWTPDNNGHVDRLAARVSDVRLAALDQITDERDRKAAYKWAMQSQHLARMEAIQKGARSREPFAVAGDAWDTDNYLLGVANGVVDLHTGALSTGHPPDRITLHSPVAYDPAACAPRWDRFLSEVFGGDATLIAFVRRFAGYSLTGDTREHKLLVCYGEGSNGKSTLLKTMVHIAGDYGYTMPFSTVEAQRNPGGPTNDLAALAGRRLIVSSEVNEGQQLNESRIKALTGGDAITARFLNKEYFTFRPVATFWLAVNHRPRVKDDSRGFWRRIALLPFSASFEGAQEDKDLEAALQAESPGILAWMVRGCLEWQRDGMGYPDAVTEATKEYQDESDPLAEFLADACIVGEQQAVRANVLYHAYLDWTNEQGLKEKECLSHQRFGRMIATRYSKMRDSQGNTYRGVGLSFAWQERAKGSRFAV